MELTLREVDIEVLDLDALSVGVTRLLQIVEDESSVHLVVAGDFVAAVRQFSEDEWDSETYEAERLFGLAAAKTMHSDTGTTMVVVNAVLFHRDFIAESYYEKLMAHEAYHVVTSERAERLSDLRARTELDPLSRKGLFAGMAGVAAEEYRVELACWRDGLSAAEEYWTSYPDVLASFNDKLVDGVTNRYEGEPIDRGCEAVITAFRELVTLMAYLAAGLHGSDGTVELETSSAFHARFVGEHLPILLSAFERLPAANIPTPRETLDQISLDLADVMADWLEYIGFGVYDVDDRDGFYFDVLRYPFD